MAVDQAVTFVADEAGQSPDRREVEAVSHGCVVERGVRALVHGAELALLEAGESSPITETGQSLAQKVLHALGPA